MGQQKSPLFLGLIKTCGFSTGGEGPKVEKCVQTKKNPGIFFEVSGQALVDLLNHAKENGYVAWWNWLVKSPRFVGK